MPLEGMFAMGKMKKSSGGGAPKCSTCKAQKRDTTMKPSVDGNGKKIWICPYDPTHPTRPRS